MGERRYFIADLSAVPKRKPTRKKARDLKGLVATVVYQKGPWHANVRVMKATRAAKQMARQQGARTIQESGKAYVWTTESARKAAFKRWRHTWKNPKTGKRFVPLVKHMPYPRAELRAVYAHVTQNGVTYVPEVGWRRQFRDGTWHPISEKAALIRLGFLENPHGGVPVRVSVMADVSQRFGSPARKPHKARTGDTPHDKDPQ